MSEWGEGAGVPMSVCVRPDKPSYDPAEKVDTTDKKIMWLCEHAWSKMATQERDFCTDVYGRSPLSRKQHIRVYKLHRKYSEVAP